MAEAKITSLVIDPAWGIGIVNLDGTDHAFLKLTHPTHGDLNFHLPHETVAGMHKALGDLKSQLK